MFLSFFGSSIFLGHYPLSLCGKVWATCLRLIKKQIIWISKDTRVNKEWQNFHLFGWTIPLPSKPSTLVPERSTERWVRHGTDSVESAGHVICLFWCPNTPLRLWWGWTDSEDGRGGHSGHCHPAGRAISHHWAQLHAHSPRSHQCSPVCSGLLVCSMAFVLCFLSTWSKAPL